jgi:hypothetical protein
MLPKVLQYQTKVEAANAKSYRSNIAPQNGTGPYNPNELITINIPTRNNLTLVPSESYLKFKATYTQGVAAGNYIRLDACGAHGLIQRIRVFHGSNLLSDIENYGLLAKILMDAQVSTDATYGKFSILAGTRSDLVSYGTSAVQVKSGKRVGTVANITPAAVAIGATVSDTYCINLISLVGTLCAEKYIPLFAMTSAPLRIEIQLVQNALQSVAAHTALSTTVPLQVSNVEYVAQFVEISDSAVDIISQSLGGRPLQFVVPDFKCLPISAVVPAGSSTGSVAIAAKYASLKALFIAQRESAKANGALTYFPYSCNVFNLASYSFRIGPNVVPSKAPETLPEMYAESVKAIGSMSSLNHQPSIDLDSYTQNLPVANDDSATANGVAGSGSFVIGLDLENYVNADKSNIFAGWNSSTDDIYFQPVYSGLVAQTTIKYDTFANFDSVIKFENNTAYVSS